MATTTKTTTAENQAAASTVAPEDLKTEQEKAPKGAEKPPLVKLGDTEAVSVPDEYPEGSPQDPEEAFVAAHGFKRAKE